MDTIDPNWRQTVVAAFGPKDPTTKDPIRLLQNINLASRTGKNNLKLWPAVRQTLKAAPFNMDDFTAVQIEQAFGGAATMESEQSATALGIHDLWLAGGKMGLQLPGPKPSGGFGG